MTAEERLEQEKLEIEQAKTKNQGICIAYNVLNL